MTPAEIIDELNDHGFEDTSTTRKMGAINDTISDVCSREPWPFLEAECVLNFDGTSPSPTNLPVDFSKVLGMQYADGRPLGWERWEVLRKKLGPQLVTPNVSDSGIYYFVAGDPRVYPLPSAGDTVSMQYVRFHLPVGEGDPESAILIPARHHRVITLGAAYKLYVMEDDAELGASFSSDYDKRIAMMREDLIREQYDVSDHIFVVDEEDWVYDLHPWT